MKTLTLIIGLVFYSLSNFSYAADGKLPGDNLDLNAVLELFKDSKSVEDFENKLNSEKSNINNLDLNEDGFVDYIRVVDYVKDNAHLITLQVAFTADEVQDVAVIELDRRDDKTVVQIVGDEALYGRDYIVEPATDNAKMAYNASNWSSVQYIYGPTYIVYVSPWYYGFYPHWHHRWRPYSWDVYYGYVHPYHSHYRHCGYYRSYHAHHHYYGHKSYSPTYYNSPKHKVAQQSLPVHKQAMSEKQIKNLQTQKVDGNVKSNINQREVRKVDTNPVRTVEKQPATIGETNSTQPSRTTTTTRTAEPTVRTQTSTRNTQTTTRSPQTTSPTRQPTRSPELRSVERTPQRTSTPSSTRQPSRTTPSRSTTSPQKSTGVTKRPK